MDKKNQFDLVPDMDFDGDRDLVDILLYDDEFETQMKEERNTENFYDADDEDDEDSDDIDEDDEDSDDIDEDDEDYDE